MYFPNDGTLLPFCSVPLKGLVYDAAAASLRAAVQLRARTAEAAGLVRDRRALRAEPDQQRPEPHREAAIVPVFPLVDRHRLPVLI